LAGVLYCLGLVTISADNLSVLNSLDLRNVSCKLMINNSQEEVDASISYWPDAIRLEMPQSIEVVDLPSSFKSTPGGGHILYTSGTTGTYKKIFHDASLDIARREARQALKSAEQDNVVNVTFYGPWTAIGHRVPFFTWASGTTVVFDSRKNWPLYLGDHGVTQVSMTTGALKSATDTLGQSVSKSRPRWSFELTVGGGVTSGSLIRLVRELITPNLIVSFGCTEMFTPVMRSNAQELADDYWLKPIGLREIEIVNEDGSSCPDLVEGILRIRRQPTDYSSYLNDPETTSRVFRDGYFYPGDMAVRRADGRIQVLGRTSDVIIVRGNKRPSAVLEEGIREILGATNVCAFSGLMSDNEDRIVLAVETATPLERKIYNQLASKLKIVIGNVHFVELKKFPLTRSGTLKIDRVALRKLVMNTPLV
jgi:acyl-coenzyme A synthetase/AMP-(fatty) acid ligase